MRNKIISLYFLCILFTVSLFAQQKRETLIPEIDGLSKRFSQWSDSIPEDRVYLQCDKPFYVPGETIWFSVFTRDAATLKPSSKSDIIYVELLNPKGSVEKQITLIARSGIAKGDFLLDAEISGGLYTLKAFTSWQKNDPDPAFFTKEIQVQSVILPRLKMNLEFTKKAYGVNDKVSAKLTLLTNENKPLTKFPINFTAAISGVQIQEKSITSDIDGKVDIDFNLPALLSSADGLLNVFLNYDGQTESISRSIPIVLNRISLSFFPEGGDLVSGLTSQIAFKAKNEFGKGADIEGFIIDNDSNKIAEFSTIHLGMGTFILTPQEGKHYTAHITRPQGVSEEYALPEAMPQGYVLSVREVTQSSIGLSISSTRDERLCVFMQMRGKEYFLKEINARKGITPLNIDLTKVPIGVAQITLFDSKEIERAERLVFVNKQKQLSVTVKTDKERYLPREKVKLTITATDETGMRMPGHFSLSVSDDQLLSFADDKSSTILSHMLAEADVKGKIEEPRFYFDPKEKMADKALDLLLMTQGWRRFTWQQINENDYPAISNPSEKAVIAGVAIDPETNKGAPGVVVSITELNIETCTGNDGAFSFKNIDLHEPKTIKAKKGQLQAQTTLNMFTSSLQLRLNIDGIKRELLLQKIIKLEQTKQHLNMRRAQAVGIRNFPEAKADQMKIEPLLEPDMKQAARDKKKIIEQIIPAHNAVFQKIMKPDVFVERNIRDENNGQTTIYYRTREFVVPDYSQHQQSLERSDFRSTIFWNGDVEVGKNGTATVEFYTNDAITSFRAITEGFSSDGGIGRTEQAFYTQAPISLSAKIPASMITGDTLEVPLLIKNTTKNVVEGKLTLNIPSGLKMLDSINKKQIVEANGSKIIPVKIIVESVNDSALFVATFEGQGLFDAFSLPVKIVSQGFPADLSFSGNELEKNLAVKITNPVKNSVRASFKAYPSVTSDLLAGIDAILKEPYGCFEQTSMSSYPNALVLSYLRTIDNPDQKLVHRAEELLLKGYKKLETFETKEKGYEWFGQTPGHEALTAYGLMQFNDINKISLIVNKSMIDRTTAWLMSRRDKKGGFLRNPQALDSYGSADQDITNAYIVYALAEAGRRDLQNELDESVKTIQNSADPYVLALVVNALYSYDDFKRGDIFCKTLFNKQNIDGSWCGTRHSITRSEGISLKLETTALACMAIMRNKQPDLNILTKGIKFILASRRGGGGFGATQSTILSLKALTLYAQFARKTDSPGTIIIAVNGKDVTKKSYVAGERNAIEIDSIERFLKENDNEVTIRFVNTKTALPYTFAVSYNTWQPTPSVECKVQLETTLAASTAKVGQTIRVSAVIANKTDSGLPMTLVVLGLPAGLSAQPWQLKELQERKTVDFYEITGSTVVFYYRQMKPGEKRIINIDCKAEIPGSYTAPASSAYLYYTNEYKTWTNLKSLRIEP